MGTFMDIADIFQLLFYSIKPRTIAVCVTAHFARCSLTTYAARLFKTSDLLTAGGKHCQSKSVHQRHHNSTVDNALRMLMFRIGLLEMKFKLKWKAGFAVDTETVC